MLISEAIKRDIKSIVKQMRMHKAVYSTEWAYSTGSNSQTIRILIKVRGGYKSLKYHKSLSYHYGWCTSLMEEKLISNEDFAKAIKGTKYENEFF